MKDELGNRIKSNYEDRTRVYLPRRTNTIIRIDGKAFHTFTRNCKKPFDDGLIEDMDNTAIALCKQIQGAKIGYVQSDEISILLTDYEGPQTDAWFDGNIQKIVSISASIAAAEFNNFRLLRQFNEYVKYADSPDFKKLAYFDSRVFTIPDITEVVNYFKWRTDDASRNSVQMVARSLYSHKECDRKNNSELQDMIHQKGQNWNDLDDKYKRGRLIYKDSQKDSKEIRGKIVDFERTGWRSKGLEDFTFKYWNELIIKAVQ
jgi:tRNA(His) 5'-end guanylyltransferase